MKLPEGIQIILHTLEDHGYEAWLVGGCVRDFLMGKEPHDYDIATSALPQQVMELFEHAIPTGIAHGTITVIVDGAKAEVTTYRKEGKYKDHRHPDAVEFVPDIQEDLARRDFTINAMAWHPERGLLDPFGGQKDLQDGRIRAVGNPHQRFEEDALRMLRAHRFAARLKFDIEPETKKAIRDLEDTASLLAVERIVPEIEEIMRTSPQELYEMTGLLKPWIPELEVMKHTAQNSVYHYTDVLQHTLDALKCLKPWDRSSAWALLLHDTGKPAVKTTDARGDHFKKHEIESEKIARRVMKTLKLDGKTSREVPRLVRLHDTFYAPRLMNLYKLRVEQGLDDDLVQKLFAIQQGDILAHASHNRLPGWQAFRDFYEQNKNLVPLAVCQLPLKGEDFVQAGLQGADIKKAQEWMLKEMILNPQSYSRKSAEDLLRKYLRKQDR